MLATLVCLAWLMTLAAGTTTASSFLATWQGSTLPLFGNDSLLDLVFPGTHDTLTGDLSTRIADNSNNMPAPLADLLHDLVPAGEFGDFVHGEAQTQNASVTDMLDYGLRFFDFRLTYTEPPAGENRTHSWYGLHFCETNQPALVYLEQISAWLDAHPSELVVLWLSHHGAPCENGTMQYPGTTPAIRQAFWAELVDVIGATRLFNASRHQANATPLYQLVAEGVQVAVYASDYKEFTASSPLALDACLIDNYLLQDIAGHAPAMAAKQWSAFGAMDVTLQAAKAQGRFVLMSLATSTPYFQVARAAELRFDGNSTSAAAKCAAEFAIPGMTEWCPPLLLDISQLTNYYNQRMLSLALAAGFAFPNAIYLDDVDVDGTIRTGLSIASQETERFAYVAVVIESRRRSACAQPDAPQAACASLANNLASLLQQYPAVQWNQPAFGRLIDWPPLD